MNPRIPEDRPRTSRRLSPNATPGRTVTRAGLRLGAGMVASLALLLAGCGGGGDSPAPPGRAGGPEALRASAPGEFLGHARHVIRLRNASGSAGLGQPDVMLRPMPVFATTMSGPGDAPRHSVTATQEEGVDEADLVKTDGRRIFTMDTAASVGIWPPVAQLRQWVRAEDGSVSASGALTLPAGNPQGLQFVPEAGRLAALVEQVTYVPGQPAPCNFEDLACIQGSVMVVSAVQSDVVVQTARVDDAGTLAEERRLAISGRLVSSRQVGGRLVLVTAHQPTPDLGASQGPLDAAALETRLAALKAEDILPTLQIDGGPRRALLADTDCYVQPGNASLALEVTTVTVLDLRAPDAAPASRCFLGGSEALYMSERSLYIATTRWAYKASTDARLAYAPEVSTDLHKFAFDGSTVAYRGSGSVAGHLGWDALRKPYRLSEHDGRLRVLSFTGETGWISAADAGAQAPSPATLTILEETATGDALRAVASLPNGLRPEPLGKPGEQVYGVRFLGEQAFVVTFRQTDPLYVLDLSRPADPRVVGVLEVPGFSDHLYPLGSGLLLGIGRDADDQGVVGGVKAALFDVSDPAQPALLASVVTGGRATQTALDYTPHGMAMLRAGTTVRLAVPMADYSWTGGTAGPLHGLLRLEVDTAARTLKQQPTLEASRPAAFPEVWSERALHIGDHVYHLSHGELTGWLWA